MKARFLFLLCVLGFAGCSEAPLPPDQFRLNAADVYERLTKSDFKDFMRNRQCGILIYIKIFRRSEKAITWQITSSGREMLQFTANIEPVRAGVTRVSISLPKDPKTGREVYDGEQFHPRPAVLQPVRPAIEEQIAALLEGRPVGADRLVHRTNDGNTFSVTNKDRVCLVQRGAVQSGGKPFSIEDEDVKKYYR